MNGSFSVGWVVMKKLEKTIINGQIINFNRTYNYLEDLFHSNIHANRIVSMANAVLGVITSASLAISMIGFGLAVAKLSITHKYQVLNRGARKNPYIKSFNRIMPLHTVTMPGSLSFFLPI